MRDIIRRARRELARGDELVGLWARLTSPGQRTIDEMPAALVAAERFINGTIFASGSCWAGAMSAHAGYRAGILSSKSAKPCP
jgi:hypothetical protein